MFKQPNTRASFPPLNVYEPFLSTVLKGLIEHEDVQTPR